MVTDRPVLIKLMRLDGSLVSIVNDPEVYYNDFGFLIPERIISVGRVVMDVTGKQLVILMTWVEGLSITQVLVSKEADTMVAEEGKI